MYQVCQGWGAWAHGPAPILVVSDLFSKPCHLLLLKGILTSSIMSSDSFRSQHCIRHGPQLISKVWKAFFTRLIVSLSFGYHPQSTGQTERKIQQIGCFLQTFCHSHQDTPAQLGAQSQIHWPLHHHQTDKPNHPTVATPLILQDSSLFPCFTP